MTKRLRYSSDDDDIQEKNINRRTDYDRRIDYDRKIKSLFNELKQLLAKKEIYPNSKLEILQSTIQYIKELEQNNTKLGSEMFSQSIVKDLVSLRQKLESLPINNCHFHQYLSIMSECLEKLKRFPFELLVFGFVTHYLNHVHEKSISE